MNPPESKRQKDPLEGKTLEHILTELSHHFGWPALAKQLPIKCFTQDPSISSSLKFLRRTSWARIKLEKIYRSFVQGKLQK